MQGWTIIFALLFLLGLISRLAGVPFGHGSSVMLATGTMGTLLFAFVVSGLARRLDH
jgi:hypothetical protein